MISPVNSPNMNLWKLDPEIPITIYRTHAFAFNHIFYYAIADEMLWYKERKQGRSWTPIYVEGKPEKVYCDGANLGVVTVNPTDGKREFVSKKCLTEKRCPGKGSYLYQDISQQSAWRPAWYHFHGLEKILSLPLFSYFFPYAKKRLEVPENAQMAFSHRGLYNWYYEDPSGNQHHEQFGISQLAFVDSSGKKLWYADPGLPAGAIFSHEIPEGFRITAMDVSASMFMLLGYDSQENLKLITKIIDFDIKGYHPWMWLNGSYLWKRDMTPEDWKDHPLPYLSGKAQLIHHVTIEQIGAGNDARKLILRGRNSYGDKGCFIKCLDEPGWLFFGKSESRTPAASPSS